MVIGTLEGLAGRQACIHASDAGIAEVRALHDRMIEMYRARNRMPYFKLNQQIHSAILRLSGNESLAYVHGILQARLRGSATSGTRDRRSGPAPSQTTRTSSSRSKPASERLAAALMAHMDHAWERVKGSSDREARPPSRRTME